MYASITVHKERSFAFDRAFGKGGESVTIYHPFSFSLRQL